MGGIFIYWFGWMLWIIITFLMSKKKKNQKRGLLLLILLSILPYRIDLPIMTISVAFVLLFLSICWQIRNVTFIKLAYYLIVTWTISAAYGAYQLILLFDPVIELIDERWLSAVCVSIIAIVLVKSFIMRFYLSLLGLLQGDYLVNLVMRQQFDTTYEIGSLYFFDKIAIVSLVYGFIWCVVSLSSWLNRSTRSTVIQQSS